jgi:hypothetical protein
MNTHRFRSSEILALVCTAMPMAGSASAPAEPIAGGQPDVGPFRLESALWSEPYSGPLGAPKGAQRAVLGVDPKTKGETYYAHFPGDYVVIPPNVNHGLVGTAEDVYILIRRDGLSDQHFVEPLLA